MNNQQTIFNDQNGVTVDAIETLAGEPCLGHFYAISGGDIFKNGRFQTGASFQRGPVKENGVNGATSEAYLAILIHRTKVLNAEFPCDENNRALYHLDRALEAFNDRTRNRVARGVEGLNLE